MEARDMKKPIPSDADLDRLKMENSSREADDDGAVAHLKATRKVANAARWGKGK